MLVCLFASESSWALEPALKTKVLSLFNRHRIAASGDVCTGRLTLTSGTPITTSDVTAATDIYFTPYHGHQIALYDGSSNWELLTFSEISVSVPSTSATPFDIFVYNNSGTVTLATSDWTNDTTRAIALTTQDGVYVKSGTPTYRYLGTGRTTSVAGQTEDSLTKRFLWNHCNRVHRALEVQESTSSWSYGTNSWRAANNSTANRVEFVLGLAEGIVTLILHAGGRAGTSGEEFGVGIGQDSTSSYHTDTLGLFGEYNVDWDKQANGTLHTVPSVGYHYYQWLEIAPSGTATFYGNGIGISGMGGFIRG